jgi:hypothetical protein
LWRRAWVWMVACMGRGMGMKSDKKLNEYASIIALANGDPGPSVHVAF